ncbi:MAG: helix-turn-helix domain-containing protein [Pseudolysinimonas sp.]
MTVTEAAEYARRHPRTIGDALRAGELHGFQAAKKKGARKGGNWLTSAACVDAWIEGRDCEHQLPAAA